MTVPHPGGCSCRTLLSHTSELRRFLEGRSFVAAAEAALARAGDAVTDMAYFPACDDKPAEACRAAVEQADVFVLIAGFTTDPRSGSARGVRHELEHETAETLGLPRLVFLLGDPTQGPAALFRDPNYGTLQEAFAPGCPRAASRPPVPAFSHSSSPWQNHPIGSSPTALAASIALAISPGSKTPRSLIECAHSPA